MRLFTYVLRAARGAFLIAVAISLVSGAAGGALVALVDLAVRRPEAERASLAGAYVAVCVAAVGTRFVSQYLLYRLSQDVVYRLRRNLVDRVLGAPLRVVEKTGTARLYAALSDDIAAIGSALPGLPAVCSGLAFVAVAVTYLVAVSPVVAAATVVATAAAVGCYRLFARLAMRYLGAAREDQDRLFEHFRAVTAGIKELKLNRRRATVVDERLDRTAVSYREHSVAGLSVFDAAAGSGTAVLYGLIGALLFALPAIAGLAQQQLIAGILVLLFLVASVQGILVLLPQLGRASVALQSIQERLAELAPEHDAELTPHEPGPSGTVPRFAGWQRIRLTGVTHVYPGPREERFLLGPLDLEVRRGEVLFVVGGNGSGKTTLAKVLTSLYPPESGAIRVDGTQVSAANRDEYRQLFSAVFADYFLFDGLLGAEVADRAAQSRRYLRRLQLDHKVTIVGDRLSTTALSQGQRKRLALLAAYLEDRSCYVFDEWAADQDPSFKEFFYGDLLPELKRGGKAVVVISHDDRYFHTADRLVRLEEGQLKEVPDAQTMVPRA